MDNQLNLKEIWKDTSANFSKYKHTKAIKQNSEFEFDEADPPTKYQSLKRKIKVYNNTIFEVMQSAVKAGFNPLVVVSANDNYPVPGMVQGFLSIETQMFRTSNMYLSVEKDLYPMKPHEFIYVPNVTFFKDEYGKKYNPYQVSLMLISPIKRPLLISTKNDTIIIDSYSNKTEESLMQNKIFNMFKLALSSQHDCIILPDFGCQTEQNPIAKILEFFNKAITRYPVDNVFFAVQKNHELFHEFIDRLDS